jgi:RecA/RadA recombinase
MAKKKKEELDDFTSDLIKSLNKERGNRVAYNLSTDDSPTHVKRWISTGSKQLDYIIANKKDGGLPEGRIVEIFGPPSIGKSHIATQIARSTQKMGGIVVYIDTENATSVENLRMLGVDISKRFVYVDTHCTEEVLSIAETTPGGMAIPFHSSVRIKLGAGSQILNKDKEPIGINVSAKTIKNKVSAPFRTCNFEIHFGKGIKEHEQMFDLLRKHGPEEVGNYHIEIAGNGAWKNLVVSTLDTGEVIVDKKFYKADFHEIIDHPEYGQYVNMILEQAMIRKNETEEPDIDAESYSDIRAVHDHIIEEHAEAFKMLK